MPEYKYEIVKNNDGSINCYRFGSSRDGIRYFVDNYGPQLAKAIENSGIFLSVAIAQKCQESAYGTSRFAREYNNFGGMMNRPPYSTSSIAISGGRKIAVFPSAEACFRSYVETLLSPTKKYISMGLLTAKTPKEQMKAIAMGGYCTNPPANEYYNSIIPRIELCLDMFNTGKIVIK